MNKSRHVLTSLVMVPLAALVAVPFYYIVVNTFKTHQETATSPLALPSGLRLDNYVEVFETLPVLQNLLNTVIVTAASVTTMLLIGAMGAFGMIIRSTRFNTWFGALMVLAFLVPFQATLLPLYRMLVTARLVDTLQGLVVLYATGAIFCYFLILGYMRTVPTEIIEAARLDGAGPLRIFWNVVMPLIRPILITVGVFQTMWVWNDFIIPNVFISSTGNRTLVLLVYSAVGQFSVNWPMFMTLTVIVLIPMVIFFVTMQRFIVSGLVAGGVKG
ncbi:carbohydrate ABC transporter permease [Actinotalea sp. K2]|uniref:carbohydrate ABC transporter permease n=1 Tax=Actinotalea sp. K2 TaxID=2939438 RepID=UPI002017A092|nr:carbohydrate ABC transporter permease [Actinotalea sp. K2]MCL3861714.1 carbohydrate ABC transporter permease [Actinotalea sp. K2]